MEKKFIIAAISIGLAVGVIMTIRPERNREIKQVRLYLDNDSSSYVEFIQSKYKHPNPDAGTLRYKRPTERENLYCSSWLVFYYAENEIDHVGDMDYHIWAEGLNKIGYIYGSFRDIQSRRISEGPIEGDWWENFENIDLFGMNDPIKSKNGLELYKGSISPETNFLEGKENEYRFALFLNGERPMVISGPETISTISLDTKRGH